MRTEDTPFRTARYSVHPILLPLSYGWFEVDLLPSCCLLKGARREKVGRKSRGGKGEEKWMRIGGRG